MNNKFRRIVSLARKRCHNKDKQNEILANTLPDYSFDVEQNFSSSSTSNKLNTYIMEIGFGEGENILQQAENNPQKIYIGCEVFTAGVVSLLTEINAKKIKNIKVWYADALELIVKLPANSLAMVYILYPDPWPKRRHNKRRLINKEFLEILCSKIHQNGEILIVTDHQDYAEHITEVLQGLSNIFDLKKDSYPEIALTKYAKKAQEKGLKAGYFHLFVK